MALYAISDTHLSFSSQKSMTVFGGRWLDYENKLKTNWLETVGTEDWVVIPGDISWGMSLEESLEDFRFLAALPGRKIIGKGNHDYWWSTLKKLNSFAAERGLGGIYFLHNNAYLCGDLVVCGTRGWFVEEGALGPPEDYKVLLREAGRLRASIAEAKKIQTANPGSKIRLFLHYPPIYGDYFCPEIMEVLEEEGIERCYYGHIHTASAPRIVRKYKGIEFALISADYLNFKPVLVE